LNSDCGDSSDSTFEKLLQAVKGIEITLAESLFGFDCHCFFYALSCVSLHSFLVGMSFFSNVLVLLLHFFF
jgi:hypothetical protein